MEALWAAPTPFAVHHAGSGTVEIRDFGSNPGRLTMQVYVPSEAPPSGAPLIVLLHGCGQSATEFGRDGGWFAFAERHAVPLVLPEQSENNNRNRCFNWFRPSDVARGRGEALSMRQMVTWAVEHFHADPHRVFVVGLSAGGAMAAGLLATYPDVFAAGAVVAGLPVGCARTPAQAFARMQHADPDLGAGQWAALVRQVGPANWRGPWPRISIWQGTQDRTVDPRNAESLAAQWTALHGLDLVADRLTRHLPGATRSVWEREPGEPVVESWTVDTLAHGFPVASELIPEAIAEDGGVGPWLGFGALGFPFAGTQGPRFVQAVGIDAVAAIAEFWGLV
ncbi:MAG: PHB depolymerase family esterase [Alphaproteobacteria bacterium]|nr:PHB depolymerase family esterase [Alphaproteobacteria bacterium]